MDFFYDKNKKVDGDRISQEAFMDFKEDTYDVLGSVFLRNISKIEQVAEGTVTDEECRFDNISYKHFQKVNFWWILMEYNDYLDWDIKTGDTFKVPSQVSINSMIHKLIIQNNYLNLKK